MNSKHAASFLKAWDDQKDIFPILSSGSTGQAKTIYLQRRWMKWSADKTGEVLKPQAGEKLFCCIPVSRVGGLMMLVRARVWGLNIMIEDAIANPLLKKIEADIISLTPYQLYHVLSEPRSYEHLKRFREVLIGGAELSSQLEELSSGFPSSTHIRHSYGMSETYSHIALRDINGDRRSEWFRCFDEVHIRADQEQCAVIDAPFTNEELYTNDIIELRQNNEFRVLGRKDFVINSGGVKLQVELIEKLIGSTLQPRKRFIISSIKDELLNNKMVLVCEDKNEFEGKDMAFLKQISPYAVPKLIVQIEEIPLNEGGKTDRMRIKSILEEKFRTAN